MGIPKQILQQVTCKGKACVGGVSERWCLVRVGAIPQGKVLQGRFLLRQEVRADVSIVLCRVKEGLHRQLLSV